MQRRRFLKIVMTAVGAMVVPSTTIGCPLPSEAVALPVVDGYEVCFDSRTLTYTGKAGNYTVNELYHFLNKGYECVAFEDPIAYREDT